MIKWSENFSVKHKNIDEQHKKLIEIIEQIAFLISQKEQGFTSMVEVIDELDKYVEEHFEYEEALMRKYSYGGAEEHIKQHNDLRNKMDELNIFSLDNTMDFYKDLLAYLADWLLRHIMQIDRKFGFFLSEISEK